MPARTRSIRRSRSLVRPPTHCQGSPPTRARATSLNAVPAYTLALGAHTLTAIATDNAGNQGTGFAHFTVSVTPASLCNLTTRFIDGSASYQRLSVSQQAAVNKLASAACLQLATISARSGPVVKAVLVALYRGPSRRSRTPAGSIRRRTRS